MTKSEPKHNPTNADTERIERWRWMLEQDVPIIGGWMHRRITSALTESALSGNWLAAQSLAVVFVFHEEADVRKAAGQTLRRINYATGIDAVWGVWAETRNPGLDDIVVDYNRLANHPASVRLLSALRLSLVRPDVIPAITRGSPDLVPPLIQASADRDPALAARAREVMLGLHNPASIDALCRAWQSNRSLELAQVMQKAGYVAQKPADTRVLSALKINKMEVITHGSAEMVAPLIAACQDADAEIAARARQSLTLLQDPAAVDEFCRLWSEARAAQPEVAQLLESALLRASYQARGGPKVRLLVALKTGHMGTAEKAVPESLPFLMEATRDADETIRQRAQQALAHLKDADTIDALCRLVIDTDDPLARQVALESGYAPREPEMRALFLFLTEQWAEYDALDFDQSLMRAVYEASPNDLRQRIAARVQRAGRTDYLTILAGVDYRSRAEQVNPGEAALMIRILAGNREFDRLWALAPELALPFSLEIIRILSENNWQPPGEVDRPVFDELVRLSKLPIQMTDLELSKALPLALPRATLKVKGRVNEVAFSPTQPLLAIATNQRKVVIWNFQTAQIERVLNSFKHSVGKVSYTPQGILLCAERTNNQSLCAVTAYPPFVDGAEDSFELVAHQGTVTVLEPVGEDRLLTAGRDNKAFLWDLTNKRKLSEKTYSFWPRSAAISPDQQQAALLHDRLALVRLPELSIVHGFPYLVPRADGFKAGVAQNAAFSPDGKFLLAGQYNGQVGMYYHTSLTQRPRKAVVTQHSQPVRGIHFLPGHPLVITAGAEGQVRFIRWPDLQMAGMVFSPDGHLTSLTVSHHGAFMATGTNEASLVLWDLRVLDIPDLFAQPLATATHDQVSTVLALAGYLSLPEPVRNALIFLRVLLQYRFRYDIQVEDAPKIQFGEFDIVLDEV